MPLWHCQGRVCGYDQAGIVGPLKVVRSALVDASSVASLLITSAACLSRCIYGMFGCGRRCITPVVQILVASFRPHTGITITTIREIFLYLSQTVLLRRLLIWWILTGVCSDVRVSVRIVVWVWRLVALWETPGPPGRGADGVEADEPPPHQNLSILTSGGGKENIIGIYVSTRMSECIKNRFRARLQWW